MCDGDDGNGNDGNGDDKNGDNGIHRFGDSHTASISNSHGR